MLIAARSLDLGNGQKRDIGDPIPEAASWRNLRSYIEQRWVMQIEEGLALHQLDGVTQMMVRRLGIESKLVKLGVLKGNDHGPVMTMADVGREIAGADGRINTHEIDAATLKEVRGEKAPEPMTDDEPTVAPAEKPKKAKGRKK